jgi:hypothetical protein
MREEDVAKNALDKAETVAWVSFCARHTAEFQRAFPGAVLLSRLVCNLKDMFSVEMITIYLQAKKWEGTVGRPEIQKFVGALHGKRARNGIFITTSIFSGEAEEYVRNIDPKVILIDGQQLADYMIDFGVGVNAVTSYEVKRIDSDYFAEE